MKTFHEYWTVNAIRGVLTLIAATVVFALPRATAYAFDIPVILLISVGCFAAFSLIEPGLDLLTSFTLPEGTQGRTALRAQAGVGIAFAALLFLVGYKILPIAELFWIAAAQAAVAAVVEFNVARTTHKQYGCVSCYSTALVFAVAAIALPFAALLTPAEMTVALAAYLAAYGFSEFSLGTRMLFVEYRAEHPVIALPAAWQSEMEDAPAPVILRATAAVTPVAQPQAACVTVSCSECSADVFCSDNSVGGQFAAVLSARQPSIVKTVRAAAILRSAEQPGRHAHAIH